jgi:hypothetical protein
MLEIGDILIAKDPCTMEDDQGDALIVGKQYTILEMNHLGEFLITSEVYEDHWFDKIDYVDFFIKSSKNVYDFETLTNNFINKINRNE